MEFISRWEKGVFYDHGKHQTLPLLDMSGDVTGSKRCSGREGAVLSCPACAFHHLPLLPAEDQEESSTGLYESGLQEANEVLTQDPLPAGEELLLGLPCLGPNEKWS